MARRRLSPRLTKTDKELDLIRSSCRILAEIMQIVTKSCEVGTSGRELSDLVFRECRGYDVKPAFLGLYGFPDSLIVSVNDAIIHGIPDDEPFSDGDLVSFDCGVIYQGMYSDMARSVVVGENAKAQELVNLTKKTFEIGLQQAVAGNTVGDVGAAVDAFARKNSLGNVKDFVGHGIGSQLHQPPEVPNFGDPGQGQELLEGMTIAIEPMLTLGTSKITIDDDKWTVRSADGSLGAHWENTIIVQSGQSEVITTVSN